KGLEFRAQKGFQYENVHFPIGLNATVTKAEFKNNFTSQNEVWGSGNIMSGDPLPYVPEVQYSLSVGTNYKKYSQEFIFNWTGKMYNESVQGSAEIPAQGLIDWSAKYSYNKEGSLYARVDNILAREYLVSLKPYGARPGKARTLLVGIKHTF
ncbi:MAG TPA: TonB-dependent receptor, partial [Bdellovibrio sp.]